MPINQSGFHGMSCQVFFGRCSGSLLEEFEKKNKQCFKVPLKWVKSQGCGYSLVVKVLCNSYQKAVHLHEMRLFWRESNLMQMYGNFLEGGISLFFHTCIVWGPGVISYHDPCLPNID